MIDRKAIKSINDRLVAQGMEPLPVTKFNTAHGEHGKFAPRGGGAGAPKGAAPAKGGGTPAKGGGGSSAKKETVASGVGIGHPYGDFFPHPAPKVGDIHQMMGEMPGVGEHALTKKISFHEPLMKAAEASGYTRQTAIKIKNHISDEKQKAADAAYKPDLPHASKVGSIPKHERSMTEYEVLSSTYGEGNSGWGPFHKGDASNHHAVLQDLTKRGLFKQVPDMHRDNMYSYEPTAKGEAAWRSRP